MKDVLSETESLCPVCLRRIPAKRKGKNGHVYLEKTCPEHGTSETLIWRADIADYQDWGRYSCKAAPPINSISAISEGCPYDCGLCPDHRANTCTLIMEITQCCNLRCPVCFASSGEHPDYEPSLETIKQMYQIVQETAGTPSIQLSGGEPTLREDLPQIISLGRQMGFDHIMVNTNGVRIAKEKDYLQKLVNSGASTIYLQFDGITDEVYRHTRGEDLFKCKKEAIRHCAETRIGVILVPTIIPGINDRQIGGIVQFAKQRVPTIKGIHFQPISYFGRYPKTPGDKDRITIPDIIRALVEQNGGELEEEHFLPRRSEDSHCAFGSLFILKEGRLLPVTNRSFAKATRQDGENRRPPWELARSFMKLHWRHGEGQATGESGCCGCEPSSWDDFTKWMANYGFTITGMPFQDVWNVDLDRLKRCCTHVVTPDRRIIPFCAYYLTSASGERLHVSTFFSTAERGHEF